MPSVPSTLRVNRTRNDQDSMRPLNLREFYPSRSTNARKGDFGRVVVCGGSDRYAGCLAFNSLAALRAGADLAIVVAPRRAADIVAGYSPDLITVPCNSPFPDPNTAIELLENADVRKYFPSLTAAASLETQSRTGHSWILSKDARYRWFSTLKLFMPWPLTQSQSKGKKYS